MTTRARMAACVVGAAVAAGALASGCSRSSRDGRADTASVERITGPVDQELATKAQEHCWFNVKSRFSKTDPTHDWGGVVSSGARTERLGDLLIVTGALEPPVKDDHFYGCALFEYTKGSPVVMGVKTSSSPLRAEALVPFGFNPDGRKQ